MYDVTKFLDDHPGGDEVLLQTAGTVANSCNLDLCCIPVVDGDLCLQNYHPFDGPDLIGVMVRKAFNRQFLIYTFFHSIFNHSL